MSTALVASALYVVILLYSGTIFQTEVVAVAWRAAVGDIIGILVVAPLVFMAVTYRPWPRPDALAFVQLFAIFGTLATAAVYFERELDYKIKRFTGLFEPAVLIGMGLVVGFVAIALVSAMYGIFSQTRR